jgi:hypothetical protein
MNAPRTDQLSCGVARAQTPCYVVTSGDNMQCARLRKQGTVSQTFQVLAISYY